MSNKNYIRGYQDIKKEDGIESNLNEATVVMGDKIRVSFPVDIPRSLINSYKKKVKDASEREVGTIFSDSDVAEEIVKYMLSDINVDKLPAGFIYGEELEVQAQTQVQPQAEVQVQTQPQAQPEVQTEVETQDEVQEGEVEVQTQDNDFDEVQTQAQDDDEETQGEESQDVEEEEEDLDLPI